MAIRVAAVITPSVLIRSKTEELSKVAVRITELVPLSGLAGEGQVIMPDFYGMIDNERVFVTAVLERTVVYISGADRKLARQSNCFVDPSQVEIRTSSNPLSWRSRGKATASVKVVEVVAPEGAEPNASDLALEEDVVVDSD
jgi:hypothetical protein